MSSNEMVIIIGAGALIAAWIINTSRKNNVPGTFAYRPGGYKPGDQFNPKFGPPNKLKTRDYGDIYDGNPNPKGVSNAHYPPRTVAAKTTAAATTVAATTAIPSAEVKLQNSQTQEPKTNVEYPDIPIIEKVRNVILTYDLDERNDEDIIKALQYENEKRRRYEAAAAGQARMDFPKEGVNDDIVYRRSRNKLRN